jgi:DNA polymerase epsilon subunit 1
MAGRGGNFRGGGDKNNAYRRAMSKGSGGSAWARNSQGARANASVTRSGRGLTEAKQYALRMGDALDKKMGFPLLQEVLAEQQLQQQEDSEDAVLDADGAPRLGWLLNLRACTLPDAAEGKYEVSAVELYFLEQDGRAFKTRIVHQPYLYVQAEENRSQEAIAYCTRRFEGMIAKAERVLREDLDLPNHLSGKRAVYVKLSFFTVSDLVTVKQALAPLVEHNQMQQRARQAYEALGGSAAQVHASEAALLEDELNGGGATMATGGAGGDESESALIGLREYDVPCAWPLISTFALARGTTSSTMPRRPTHPRTSSGNTTSSTRPSRSCVPGILRPPRRRSSFPTHRPTRFTWSRT